MPAQILQRIRIVWAAILCSTGILLYVGFRITPTHKGPPDMLKIGLLGVAGVLHVVVSFIKPRQQYERILRAMSLKTREAPSTQDTGGYRSALPTQRVIDEPQAAARILSEYFKLTVLALVLVEMPAVLGILARLMGAGAIEQLAITALSWIGILAHFPTYRAAFAPVERVYGARVEL